jgi:Arc/MetJ family transcription regulator
LRAARPPPHRLRTDVGGTPSCRLTEEIAAQARLEARLAEEQAAREDAEGRLLKEQAAREALEARLLEALRVKADAAELVTLHSALPLKAGLDTLKVGP